MRFSTAGEATTTITKPVPLDKAADDQPAEVVQRGTNEAGGADDQQPERQQAPVAPAAHQQPGGDAGEHPNEGKGRDDPAERRQRAAELVLQRRQRDGGLAYVQRRGDAGEQHVDDGQPGRGGGENAVDGVRFNRGHNTLQ